MQWWRRVYIPYVGIRKIPGHPAGSIYWGLERTCRHGHRLALDMELMWWWHWPPLAFNWSYDSEDTWRRFDALNPPKEA